MPRRAASLAVAAALAAALAPPAGAADDLRAGAGRADVTPPTGYFMFGWVRSDGRLTGQHTRLYARVLVLERGGSKFALVAEDLGGIPGGMVVDAARLVADRGFSERNVLVSASHTHAGPAGFFNFGAYNTVFNSAQTPTELNTAADPQLYAFMVRRLAEAIRRADDDLAPAAAGWSSGRLLGMTRNRSIEAHLANHGIIEEFGEGHVEEDPGGYEHTIDPEVHVLRVDKLRGRRHVPIGIWSTFANHGTDNPFTFHYYNRDHHGAATQVAEDGMRREGRVARRQEVVNVYGNTDEGDQSSALQRRGPAQAEFVGRIEARSMLKLWRSAGRRLSRRPALESRWTRVCFCGQDTSEGPVDDSAVIGLPLLTGSEEGRGPLFDVTGVPFEGRTTPVAAGAQGHKVQVLADSDVPNAVPLTALRVGDGMVVSVPGEMTAEMGRRVRGAVSEAVAGSGVRRVTISGLANEYLQYFTTPEEYDRQHYEGGSMLFGRTASLVLRDGLVGLAQSLVQGRAAAEPYPFDPTNGLTADSPPFGAGADAAQAVEQPKPVQRLQRAAFAWHGGPRGEDRPLDRAFVSVERRVRGRWRAADSDLGLRILWEVDDDGNYRAQWEVPLSAPLGSYRFAVTANRYRVQSQPFTVGRSTALSLTTVRTSDGRLGVRMAYPAAVPDQDVTYRPRFARGGRVAFLIAGRKVVVRTRRGSTFAPRAGGSQITVPRSAATDRWGNRNGRALVVGGGT
ncbi:MAG TPA: neutral/alkaline non-lysosomal ceramidase N-terminal domain-containing protein [Thermoleophilaceae bacterium]|jgi:hypothetical protein